MENNVPLKENKKEITGKYRHILSAIFVCLSLYLASPKTPEYNSMPLVMRTNTNQQTPTILDGNNNSNENKNSQEIQVATEWDDPKDSTIISTPFEESNIEKLRDLYSKVTVSPKLNIVGGVLVDIANYPEMGIANGCSTWKAGKFHWILAPHCSAGVNDLVRNEFYSNGRQVTITQVSTYVIGNIGIKILTVDRDLPLSKPLAINSNPYALTIGRDVSICGHGVQTTTGGYFPSQLACSTNPIITFNSFSLGTRDIGKGLPYPGDSGAPMTIINKKTGVRAAISSQEYLIFGPLPYATTSSANYSDPIIQAFIRDTIPDVLFVNVPAEYTTFIPRISK